MVGHVVRAGGSVLAALSIAAGGMAMGVGSAGAMTGTGPLISLCGFFGTPWPCPDLDRSFESEVVAGDTYVTYRGTNRAAPGDVAVFKADFYIGKPTSISPPAVPPSPESLPDVVVNSVTHHAPSGFKFTGAKVYSYSNFRSTLVDSTVVVDPVSGDVTVTAPDGGWAIPKDVEGYTDNGHITVALNYTVASVAGDSTSELTFTGTDAPAPGGRVVTGDTQDYLNSLGGWLGSSGS